MDVLDTSHGPLPLPAFLPDATRAVVRAVDSRDLEACGVRALMVNTLHLATRPGADLIAAQGGIHRFMSWCAPVASDSGGFQALSFIAGKLGEVTPEGIVYRVEKGGKKHELTPEKCIQKQFQLGADIMFCLDHCAQPKDPPQLQRLAVENTVAWARRCKREFDARLAHIAEEERKRPLLFAVVQGGNDPELRRECAERLLEIGFDGYGFGGWPVNDGGGLVEAVEQTAALIPGPAPLHGLGIGKPENVVRAVRLGYTLFDCVLPTRDARHQRLYAFTRGPSPDSLYGDHFYECLNIRKAQFDRDARPIDESCDCLCCARYSRAYLGHLFHINEVGAQRLATLHNLRFYARLMDVLRSRHAPRAVQAD